MYKRIPSLGDCSMTTKLYLILSYLCHEALNCAEEHSVNTDYP